MRGITRGQQEGRRSEADRMRVVEVLQPKADGTLGEFGRTLIQDGCAAAIKETLRERSPGRLGKQSPAAVELHVAMSWLGESVEQVTPTHHTASERAHVPAPEELRAHLLLADRGDFEKTYPADVGRAGGDFVVGANASSRPVVRTADGG